MALRMASWFASATQTPLALPSTAALVTRISQHLPVLLLHLQPHARLLVAHRGQPFSVSEVKQLMLQLLEGIAYLHENWTLHRGASRPLLLAMPLAS